MYLCLTQKEAGERGAEGGQDAETGLAVRSARARASGGRGQAPSWNSGSRGEQWPREEPGPVWGTGVGGSQPTPHPLPTVAAVYDVTLNFRGNKNPSLLGILYGKKYEADMCVR